MKSKTTPNCMLDDSSPRVTLAMLASYLDDMTILVHPKRHRWSLRGFAAHTRDSDPDLDLADDPNVLIVCQSREAQQLMESFPESPFLVVHDGDSCPAQLAQYRDRMIVFRKDRAYAYVLFMVQEFFLDMMFWGKRMAEISQGRGDFQDLIDASDHVLDNFIALSDDANVLLAYSRDIEPQEKVSRMLVKSGAYPLQMMKSLKLDEIAGKNIVKVISEKQPDGSIMELHIMPMWSHGIKFGNCLVICGEGGMTDGLRDCVALFLEWACRLCERMWRVELESKSPLNMMLVNMVAGERFDDENVRFQLSRFGVPDNPQFKLLQVKIASADGDKALASIMEAASSLNGSRSISFRYEGNVLALLYADDCDNGSFSIQNVLEDVEAALCKPFGVFVGTSKVFEDIHDIDMAFRQSDLACEYKPAIDVERSMARALPPKTVYAFEDALIYYLIDHEDANGRFRDFAFSHSFLDKVLARDEQTGNNDFALLWVYLNCDCNVSMTAKYLFMHRNTVIYHVDKIRDMFQLDFSDKGTRDRCLIDYKIKFLNMGRDL